MHVGNLFKMTFSVIVERSHEVNDLDIKSVQAYLFKYGQYINMGLKRKGLGICLDTKSMTKFRAENQK